jgi:eukaryotic-like serine/threonine-protein kinase
MPLAPGTHLGPYEILAPLGAGGMGEVYRARDIRLERTVAVKILPAQFSSDPVRKQRFEREAKAISNLNHPNICVLHDVGHQNGIDYLVMECVEGETLAKRLEEGPLPIEQVFKFGAQIADAVDKAHRRGVVHRDLKPSNIMLTSTGAKLLDFGLARPTSPLAGVATLTALPTSPVTEEGTIVGTYQYMSPEQVEGKELDARSDIFSLGAVLYEMVTGKRAFEGKSQLSVASAILEKEPVPISTATPLSPLALDHAVKKCLEKLPDDRWQSASDLASELKWIAETGSLAEEAVSLPIGRGLLERVGWVLAATFFLLLIAAGLVLWNARNEHRSQMYFHTSVPFAANDLALSSDGHTLAMVAYSAEANNYVVWIYEIGGRRTSSLGGTQGASYPFWSPDGKFIGFFADGKLKKVDVSGGHVQEVCDAPNGRGGTWNQDGVILFTPDSFGGLSRVPSSGGSPVEVSKTDPSRLETSHRWPMFLPDGKHFLYLAANFTGQLENNGIFLGSLDSQEKRLVVSTSANAAYSEPGYLLYLRDKTLVAQRFDKRRYVLSGEPHPLSDEVVYTRLVDKAVFSATSEDILVTQTGTGALPSQLTWFDRSGKAVGTVGTPASYGNVRLSADGRRVAVDQNATDGRTVDIWVFELNRAAPTRLTFDPSAHQTPIWSPDGKEILFSWNHKLGDQLYLKNADGSGSAEEIADLGAGFPVNTWDWSRDGKYVLVRRGNELWYLTWPDRAAKPLLQAKWNVQNAQFSPDGRWVAYASNETGSMEIYVSPFPAADGKWQVSAAGGQEPRWREDGKELFYVSADGKMMAVSVTTGASFKSGSPIALFQTQRRQPVSAFAVFSYDVAGDGQSFLIATKRDEATAAPLSVLLNWSSDIEK